MEKKRVYHPNTLTCDVDILRLSNRISKLTFFSVTFKSSFTLIASILMWGLPLRMKEYFSLKKQQAQMLRGILDVRSLDIF